MLGAYAHPLVPVANLFCSILVLVPLPWLLQHWNTGAWSHAIWASLSCFIVGVNTINWAYDARITAIVWCDITVRIFSAASLGIVTTCFVIGRRICLIMHIKSPMTQVEKRRANIFDLFFCIGVPILSIALSWFFQGHRFTILEGYGCTFAYYKTPIYLALYEVWYPIFGILAAIYGGFIIRALIKRRNALREVVKVDPEISLEQFRRVIALACAQGFITAPCSVYIFVISISSGGIHPWKGLGDAHEGFSEIWTFPRSMNTRLDNIIIEWNKWITVFVAFVFFLFFGLSRVMWVEYWKGLRSLAKRAGFVWPSRTRRSERSTERPDNVIQPMVFNLRSTILSVMTRGRAAGTSHSRSMATSSLPEDPLHSSAGDVGCSDAGRTLNDVLTVDGDESKIRNADVLDDLEIGVITSAEHNESGSLRHFVR